MKRVILLICVIFSAIYASGQSSSKKADKISVITKLTNIDSAIVKTANLLLENSILIDKVDYKIGYISTKPFQVGINSYQRNLLRFSIENGVVKISLYGEFRIITDDMFNTDFGWDKIEFPKIKGSVMYQAWNALAVLAMQLESISSSK